MYLFAALAISVIWIALATGWLRLHPVLALLIAALAFGLLTPIAIMDLAKLITDGFGSTVGAIGPLIMLGGIIGVFLERSGGASVMARALFGRIGSRQVTVAMGGMGFVVSIPVFCDSGFILLSPLNHAAARARGTSLAPGAIALALGLYAAHTMVPPTPGPIAAAELLGADIGLVMLVGLPIGILTMLAGVAYASLVGPRIFIAPNANVAEGDQSGPPTQCAAPKLWLASLPIALPIMLIVAGAIAKLPAQPIVPSPLHELVMFLGQPLIALATGAVIALALPRKLTREMLSERGWIGDAIRDCAVIILITGAGGAFGRVLAESGLGNSLGTAVTSSNLGLLLPLAVAAVIKTSQGSSTVAIITSAGLVAPLLAGLGLDGELDRAFVTVAIGAGAMAVSHVNDSFFWVVSRLSNMTARQALMLYSPGSMVQALAAGAALLAAHTAFG